jgi:Domain of unknown function (DUF4282)
MICSNCGSTEPEDAVYCSNCGRPVTAQAASGGQAAGPGPEAARAAYGPPPEATQAAQQAHTAQGDYGRARATGLPRPQLQEDPMSSKSYLASLFDFGFNYFVTPKIVKVVYVLITIILSLWALGFAIFAFRVNAVIGIVVLFIVCPIFFVIYLSLWRMVLELVMVVFRIAGDIRSIRARGELHPDDVGASGFGG